MNLIDAIKSGKSFRRTGETEWKTRYFLQSELRSSSMDNFGLLQQQPPTVKKVVDVSLDDLLADDWEIQESTVTITRTQFWKAYADAIKEEPLSLKSHATLLPALVKRLGFLGEVK